MGFWYTVDYITDKVRFYFTFDKYTAFCHVFLNIAYIVGSLSLLAGLRMHQMHPLLRGKTFP